MNFKKDDKIPTEFLRLNSETFRGTIIGADSLRQTLTIKKFRNGKASETVRLILDSIPGAANLPPGDRVKKSINNITLIKGAENIRSHHQFALLVGRKLSVIRQAINVWKIPKSAVKKK